MIRLRYVYAGHRNSYIERYNMEKHEFLDDDVIGDIIYTEEEFVDYLNENYGADWRDYHIISESTEYY